MLHPYRQKSREHGQEQCNADSLPRPTDLQQEARVVFGISVPAGQISENYAVDTHKDSVGRLSPDVVH